MQLSRFVFIELTTTLAGRHTAVHRWSSQHTSYCEYTLLLRVVTLVLGVLKYEEITINNDLNTASIVSKSTAVANNPGQNYCESVLEIEIEIAFAKIDLHPDCLDRKSGNLASISILNRDRKDRDLDLDLRSFPLRSNNAVLGCCVCKFRCHHRVSLHYCMYLS